MVTSTPQPPGMGEGTLSKSFQCLSLSNQAVLQVSKEITFHNLPSGSSEYFYSPLSDSNDSEYQTFDLLKK